MKIQNYAFLASLMPIVTASAFAADLPARATPPIYVPPPVPVFTWSGAYIGVNAGYAWSDSNKIYNYGNDPITRSQTTAGTVPGTFRMRGQGFTGGGQIGYNYEIPTSTLSGAGIVIGVEADAAYTDIKDYEAVSAASGVINTYGAGLDYLGTVRGRAGVAFDRFLVYGTGGFAYGKSFATQGIYPNIPSATPIWGGGNGSTQTGYAVGGGVEYAIPTASLLNPFGAGAVTLKAEFIHYDLGQRTFTLTPGPVFGPAGTSFTDKYRVSGNLVRAGLNYKFDFGAPVPVVARY